MHKCDGCKYKREHQEMKFQAVGVCGLAVNLVKGVLAYNAPKCPFYEKEGKSDETA